FVEYVSDCLLFIQITATDDLSAYLIFETLNDRGLDLSVTDLLKNYLFSIVDESDKSHVKNIWDVTINHVSYSGFPKFLRHYWMMQNGLIQEKELFKTVKRNINTASTAFDLLNSMSEVSEIYAALSDSNHQLWEGDDKVKKHIRELNLFNVTQCYPLLINAYLYLDNDDWVSILRICSVISFRYMIISGLNPNALESKYNDACKAINNGSAKTARDIFSILQPLYVNDEDFERNFESKSIRTKRSSKLARYIMYSIENHLSIHTFDFEFDNGSLEHILPENPSSDWNKDFPDDIEESFIYRLGNFTLLEPEKNRTIGNKKFDEKVSVYKTSRYELSRRFGYKKWNQENLKARQKYLAKQAKAVWSLNY
ncbi:TPA: HNH endonuclease family protein, partial [Vibrio diabolicus]